MIALMVSAAFMTRQLSDYALYRPSRAEIANITSAEYRRCTNKSLSNEAAVQCIGDEWDNVDRRLNANYRVALAAMPNSRERAQLRDAQRKWLRQQDEDCSIEDVGGHTPFELAMHQCEIDELVRRAAWLGWVAAGRSRH